MYLDLNGGHMGIYTCNNSWSYILKVCMFYLSLGKKKKKYYKKERKDRILLCSTFSSSAWLYVFWGDLDPLAFLFNVKFSLPFFSLCLLFLLRFFFFPPAHFLLSFFLTLVHFLFLYILQWFLTNPLERRHKMSKH